MYSGTTVPRGVVGDRHLVTVPQGVVGDRLPWGGEGQGGGRVGAGGAQALAALKEAPLLHTLTLDLQHSSLGSSGAQTLAALKGAPSLHTLTVNVDA